VANAQYRLCVEAEVCPEPGIRTSEDVSADRQPVLVPWGAAKAYCEWVGGRLPTQAEWEKAVRGTDGRTWPWGNEFVPNRANLSGDEDGYGPTAPVGSFPDDVGPYGLLDAAGNPGEWVADWWDAEYYTRSPARLGCGPASGEKRVHRAPIANAGGGPEKCRCVARYAADPNWEYGLRCVSVTRPEGDAETSSPGEPAPTADSAQGTEAGEAATPALESAGAAGEAAQWPPLQSYRARTVMTLPEEDAPEDVELEGPVEQEFVFEWDAAASASRTVVGAVEEVTIGDTRWTRIKDTPWQKQTLAPDERAAWEEKMSFAQLWGDADLLEGDLESALPEDVDLVPAQIFPVPVKAAMVYDGEEMVNDVRGKRYAVDTDLDYTRETGGHTTGQASGVICVADQEGVPPVIVRALMEEDLVVDGDPSHPSWEYNLTEVNQPITIEPPE
jgi:hypothetical protein